MDRGYSSGFSGWGGSGGGGSSRGSGGYDLYGYKDSMSSSGGFGGGGYGSSDRMKRGLSGGSLLSSSGSNADDVIAKINQRLDMLTQLEGGMKSGARGDRFAQYESFDSRSTSLGPRDLYRSGSFGFSDSRGDMMAQRGGVGFGVMGGAGGGGFDGSAFGSAKMRLTRDSAFSGSGWGAEQRSPRRNRSAGGRGFGRRQDSSSSAAGMGGGSGRGGGHQGHSPAGRGKLPSLLANRMYPDSGAFQSQRGPQDFPARNFGGGPRANRQLGRKRPQNRQVKAQRDGQKKRKQTLSAADEPESKMGKTDTAGDTAATDAAAGDQTQESEEAAATAGESKTDDGGESAAPSNQDESAQAKGKKTPPSAAKVRKRRGFFERSGVKVSAHRMTFACSVCKFRSFYSEDMAVHLESKFHKDHFKFLSNQLSKPTTDFLQEYLNNKYKKTEQRVSQMDNHSTIICQVFKEQDLTRDLGMEHFMKKVEAAHCSACDVFIPMQYTLIQKHLKSPDHNYNRKGMMEQSKRSSLSVARSILNHKVIGKKLESYLKGENPFNGNQDDQDPEDSLVMEVSEADLTNESLNEIKQEEEGPLVEGAEPVAEAVGNGEEHEEDAKMEAEEGEEGVEVGEEEAAEHGVDAGDADAVPAE
ncbi:A-kinase anchor protein 8-like isoform X1 [Sinocyclocheilus anshuiensis]|uniref:A-kinase anchor protein 8-like isoform X1 n=1 Tax=Sinocyclocheilus anshuiensis TaxID=1608454 RepID=UPI0007B91243|nr:PREDICTED: A-kinase anchor protein 8-like isoform X1 [Sinocyclocheilus anshuiensis]XP_016308273.1 PREDICTED: A-kinase anchor protein 8-like isoform X1 [Sinocyclocheilus anshuiensis]